MHLYHDLIKKLFEFETYDIMDEEHYLENGISPLGSIGSWLNKLTEAKELKSTHKENMPLS